MNEFEQILAHLSGCQRAFVLPPCPAEWLPTNSPRLADPAKMSTPHYNKILLFHTLPQPSLYPFNLDMIPSPLCCNPQCAALSTALFAPRTNLGCQPAEADEISSGGRTFMSDIAAYQKFLRAFVAAASRGGRFGLRELCSRFSSATPKTNQSVQLTSATSKAAAPLPPSKGCQFWNHLSELPLPPPTHFLELIRLRHLRYSSGTGRCSEVSNTSDCPNCFPRAEFPPLSPDSRGG